MDQRTKLLCENVFELSAMAEELQIIGSITVEDSRELFYLVLDWAEEFEKQFDPETQDYLTEIESFGRRKLERGHHHLQKRPHHQQCQSNHRNNHQQIIWIRKSVL